MSARKPDLAHTPAADLAPLEAVIDRDYPETWRDIATCQYVHLRACEAVFPGAVGRDHLVAGLALQITEGLRAEIGGSQPYLPQGRAYELSVRDRNIAAEFNGRNFHQLARKHHLSERRLRQILDAWQREQYARRQQTLEL